MFAYLITDTFEGKVVGTNDQAKAEELSYCEEYFVVDVQLGCAIWDGERVAIEEMA